MKKISPVAAKLLRSVCSCAFTQNDTVVHWRGLQGVITAAGPRQR